MKEIIEILMGRDNISREDAKNIIEETSTTIAGLMYENADISEIEQVIMDDLGLELDYIFYFLF